MGFSRQEYWNGLPFPSSVDLPDPGIKPGSPALQAAALPSEPPGKPPNIYLLCWVLVVACGLLVPQLGIKPTSFTTPELAGGLFTTSWASLVAQRLKCLPAMRETWVQSLGQEDPLEKEMATHSSILAWRILWTEEPGSL